MRPFNPGCRRIGANTLFLPAGSDLAPASGNGVPPRSRDYPHNERKGQREPTGRRFFYHSPWYDNYFSRLNAALEQEGHPHQGV